MIGTRARNPSLARPRRPRWVTAVAIVYVLLAAGSATIAILDPALLVTSHAQINDAARVYAGYLVSRNAAIAIVLLGSVALHRDSLLGAALAWATLIQLLDIAVDATTGRWMLLPGLALLTGLLAAAAVRLSPPSTDTSPAGLARRLRTGPTDLG